MYVCPYSLWGKFVWVQFLCLFSDSFPSLVDFLGGGGRGIVDHLKRF